MESKLYEEKLVPLLNHHKIRDVLKEMVMINGHSFAEAFEEVYDNQIQWLISIGGKELGINMICSLYLQDLELSEFNYNSNIVNYYGDLMEGYLRSKDKIPQDL